MQSKEIFLLIMVVLLLGIMIIELTMAIKKRSILGPLAYILLIIGYLFAVFLTYRGDELTGKDWAQMLLTIALVAVTAVYAFSTEKIAKATKEQAEASVKMAEEMKKPSILLRLDVTDGDVLELKTKFPPEELKISAINTGSGPAVNLEAFFWSKKYTSPYVTKGYLTQNEQWKASIIIDMEINNKSMNINELQSDLIDKKITHAIIVNYEDIYNHKFVSYLSIEVINNKWVIDGIQKIKERNT